MPNRRLVTRQTFIYSFCETLNENIIGLALKTMNWGPIKQNKTRLKVDNPLRIQTYSVYLIINCHMILFCRFSFHQVIIIPFSNCLYFMEPKWDDLDNECKRLEENRFSLAALFTQTDLNCGVVIDLLNILGSQRHVQWKKKKEERKKEKREKKKSNYTFAIRSVIVNFTSHISGFFMFALVPY